MGADLGCRLRCAFVAENPPAGTPISGRRAEGPRPSSGGANRRPPRRQLRPAASPGRDRGHLAAATVPARERPVSRRARAVAFLLAALVAAAAAATIADG